MAEKIEIVAELKDLVSSHLKDITSQVDRMDSALASAGGKGGGGIMGQVLGANLLTGAIQKTVGAIWDFEKDSVRAYGRQEQFLTSLKTMFHGNAREAEILNGQLKQFATETPFELNEIQDATKMMIAYGSNSSSVVKEMRMLGDVSSGVGSSLSEVGYLYGTLRTQGRAFSKDIYQFTGRGIPIVKELAKQFGVTDDKVMKLVEDGKVGFKEIERAFKSMTSEGGQFFGMMEQQSQTLVGKTSNLSDAWDQLKTKIGESQSGILKDTVSWATEMVNQLNRSIDTSNFIAKAEKGLGKSAFNSQGFGYKGDLKDDRHTKAGDITGAQRLEGFTEKIMKISEGAKAEDVQNKKNELTDLFRTVKREYKEGGVSTPYYASQLALISKATTDLNSIADIAKANKNAEDKKSKEDAKKPKDLEHLAKANRPTQINIHIENLVRELTNEVTSAKEALQMSHEQVAKTFISAVNDLSVLGQA